MGALEFLNHYSFANGPSLRTSSVALCLFTTMSATTESVRGCSRQWEKSCTVQHGGTGQRRGPKGYPSAMTGTLVVLSAIASSVTNRALATSFSADPGERVGLRLISPAGGIPLRGAPRLAAGKLFAVARLSLEVTLNCLRLGIRFPVEFPVTVQWKTRPGKVRRIQGKITTMSGNGVFMRLPSQLRPNTRIVLTVSLPAEVTKVPLKLRCQARVVSQMEAAESSPFGIGAVIDDYQIRTARPQA